MRRTIPEADAQLVALHVDVATQDARQQVGRGALKHLSVFEGALVALSAAGSCAPCFFFN
jgi:hypothetical protein